MSSKYCLRGSCGVIGTGLAKFLTNSNFFTFTKVLFFSSSSHIFPVISGAYSVASLWLLYLASESSSSREAPIMGLSPYWSSFCLLRYLCFYFCRPSIIKSTFVMSEFSLSNRFSRPSSSSLSTLLIAFSASFSFAINTSRKPCCFSFFAFFFFGSFFTSFLDLGFRGFFSFFEAFSSSCRFEVTFSLSHFGKSPSRAYANGSLDY